MPSLQHQRQLFLSALFCQLFCEVKVQEMSQQPEQTADKKTREAHCGHDEALSCVLEIRHKIVKT